MLVVFAALIAGCAPAGWSAPPRRARRLAGLAVAVVLVALGAGWWEQRHYLERRYENLSPALDSSPTRSAGRATSATRRSRSRGVRGVFNQYPFYGTDLSNDVQWLGDRGPDGAYAADPDLRRVAPGARRRRLHARRDDVRPVPPRLADRHQGGAVDAQDPAAKQVLRDGPVSVFEIDGPPDPAGCGTCPTSARPSSTATR